VLEEDGDKNKGRARTGSRRTSTSSATASTSSETMDAAAGGGTEADKQVAGAAAANQIMVYEFAIPMHLVGRLIGKHGCFVAQIKTETRSQIQVKKHPDQNKFKLCSLEGRLKELNRKFFTFKKFWCQFYNKISVVSGTQAEIDKALKLIRKKFPLKKYPQLTLECISSQLFHFPLIPESLQVNTTCCLFSTCAQNLCRFIFADVFGGRYQ